MKKKFLMSYHYNVKNITPVQKELITQYRYILTYVRNYSNVFYFIYPLILKFVIVTKTKFRVMKKLIVILSAVTLLLGSSCSSYTCPTYSKAPVQNDTVQEAEQL